MEPHLFPCCHLITQPPPIYTRWKNNPLNISQNNRWIPKCLESKKPNPKTNDPKRLDLSNPQQSTTTWFENRFAETTWATKKKLLPKKNWARFHPLLCIYLKRPGGSGTKSPPERNSGCETLRQKSQRRPGAGWSFTLPETNSEFAHQKLMVGRLLSFVETLCSGANC